MCSLNDSITHYSKTNQTERCKEIIEMYQSYQPHDFIGDELAKQIKNGICTYQKIFELHQPVDNDNKKIEENFSDFKNDEKSFVAGDFFPLYSDIGRKIKFIPKFSPKIEYFGYDEYIRRNHKILKTFETKKNQS